MLIAGKVRGFNLHRQSKAEMIMIRIESVCNDLKSSREGEGEGDDIKSNVGHTQGLLGPNCYPKESYLIKLEDSVLAFNQNSILKGF